MSRFEEGKQILREIKQEITDHAREAFRELKNLFSDSPLETERFGFLSLDFRIEGAKQSGEDYAVLGAKPFVFSHPELDRACIESYNATLERMKTHTRVFDHSTKEHVWLPHKEAEAFHEEQLNRIVFTREDKERLAKEHAAINIQHGLDFTLDDVARAKDQEAAELLYREMQRLKGLAVA